MYASTLGWVSMDGLKEAVARHWGRGEMSPFIIIYMGEEWTGYVFHGRPICRTQPHTLSGHKSSRTHTHTVSHTHPPCPMHAYNMRIRHHPCYYITILLHIIIKFVECGIYQNICVMSRSHCRSYMYSVFGACTFRFIDSLCHYIVGAARTSPRLFAIGINRSGIRRKKISHTHTVSLIRRSISPMRCEDKYDKDLYVK